MHDDSKRVQKYNASAYKRFTFRVRSGTPLAEKLEDYLVNGEYSINFLITKLLCEHFDVKLPHKFYEHRTRSPLVNEELE